MWILRSFAFPVLVFDTNAASENEPKSDQSKNRFRTGFYSGLKGSACRRGGDHIYIHIYIYMCLCVYVYMCICVYVYMCACKLICVEKYVHIICICLSIYMYIHVFVVELEWFPHLRNLTSVP